LPCRRRLFSRPHLPSACHYPAGAAAAASSSPPATHLPLLASRLAVTPLPPPLPPHIRPARWNTRLRQEYLYRKSLKGKECQHYEKRCRIQEVLGKGKPIPTKLRNEGLALRRKIDLGDQDRAVPRSIIDDKYAGATLREPMILLTTSRNPGQLGTACVCLSDSYRRKDTFSFLLDGQQHNRNNRSIR
uniref:Uncharacterized protein n=2 Tax=Aegilops tauschii subsp. strangulata TaxID=200361 RepID=A0A453STI9_AEGTS